MANPRTFSWSLGALLLALGLLIAACGTGNDALGPPNSSRPSVTFDDTAWRLLSGTVDGVDLRLDGDRPPTLIIDDVGGAGGSTGCNSYGGTFAVAGDGTVRVEVGQMTEMACEPALMDLESVYVDALSRVGIFVLDGQDLQLTSADGFVTLDFVAIPPEVDRPLDGTMWMLNGFLEGDAVSSPQAGAEAFVVFDLAAGSVRGSGGCNEFGAQVTVDGNGMSITEMVSTEVACEPPIMRHEADLFDILILADTWEIDGANLTIVAVDGRAAMFVASN